MINQPKKDYTPDQDALNSVLRQFAGASGEAMTQSELDAIEEMQKMYNQNLLPENSLLDISDTGSNLDDDLHDIS